MKNNCKNCKWNVCILSGADIDADDCKKYVHKNTFQRMSDDMITCSALGIYICECYSFRDNNGRYRKPCGMACKIGVDYLLANGQVVGKDWAKYTDIKFCIENE